MAINFPDSPSLNDTHTVNGRTWAWNGTYWKLSGASNRGISLQISDTAPSDPVSGDMWYESDTGRTFTYYDGFWVELGNTASVVAFIADNDGDTYVHVENSSDEDTVRVYTSGTERLSIGASAMIPATNEHYDLGSASNRFRDLYLSGSSIDLGGVQITSDGSNISLPNVDDIAVQSLSVGGENVTPYTGRRNFLYNGAMQVAQRGTSTAGIAASPGGYYTVDRWRTYISSGGTWTMSQQSDGPAGFGKSVRYLCTTAASPLSSFSSLLFIQDLEGQDMQAFKKGTAYAESFTVSFWVKSNVTGTYMVELFDADNFRSVSKSYTVSVSGAWERKTVTFPPDNAGLLDNDNQGSFSLYFWLVAGSGFTSGTLQQTWGSSVSANRAVGQTNLASAINNYWQVTGVQLETGPVATPFEHLSYGDELARCQRYYQKVNAEGAPIAKLSPLGFQNSTTQATFPIIFSPQMRAAPTFETFNFHVSDDITFAVSATVSLSHANGTTATLGASWVTPYGAQFRPVFVRAQIDTAAYVAYSAEL